MISQTVLLPVALLLLVFLLYKEWIRKNRKRLYGRLFISLLAVLSLLLMAYPYAEKHSPATQKKIVLLTDGFVKDSLAFFLKQGNEGVPVFSVSALPVADAGNTAVRLVTNWPLFMAEHRADTLHVFGNGFSKEILARLQPHSIVFHASPLPSSISHAYWKQQLQPGEWLTVQGQYENNTGQPLKIMLQAFGSVRDTAWLPPGGHDFSLHSIPLQTGTAVYTLLVMQGKDTLEKEPVPVETQAVLPLQLLILSSSPDFENTFLKNHLSQQGYQVTVSTTVSSHISNRQFLNTPVQPEQGRLSLNYLNRFDVIMADEEALQQAGAEQLSLIRAAVKDNGTGLVIRLNNEKKAVAFYNRLFPVQASAPGEQSYLQLRGAVADSSRYALKMTDPFYIQPMPGTQGILQDATARTYVSGSLYGSGKIVATTLQNTYSLALAGNLASYRQIWWLLLSKAARKKYPSEIWQFDPLTTFINNPVHLVAVTSDSATLWATADSARIYLQQDPLLPFQWHGVYWPTENGWQPLPQLNAATGNWYIYKTGNWQKLRNYTRATDTKRYADLYPVVVGSQAGSQPAAFAVNRPLCWLIVFLSCCIFLWVEQKAG